MRFFLAWMSVGALLGAVIATLVAPTVLENVLAFTGANDAMCQCSELVARTSSTLIKTQIWGVAIGAVLVPLAAFLLRRAFSKRGSMDASAAPTP
jgi:hypothetical protein